MTPAETKRKLHALLDLLGDVLSPMEQDEVREFADANEYGLALETLSALIVEENKRIPREAFADMVELADAMGIRETTITDALARHVAV